MTLRKAQLIPVKTQMNFLKHFEMIFTEVISLESINFHSYQAQWCRATGLLFFRLLKVFQELNWRESEQALCWEALITLCTNFCLKAVMRVRWTAALRGVIELCFRQAESMIERLANQRQKPNQMGRGLLKTLLEK
jgi:hypothetical protein